MLRRGRLSCRVLGRQSQSARAGLRLHDELSGGGYIPAGGETDKIFLPDLDGLCWLLQILEIQAALVEQAEFVRWVHLLGPAVLGESIVETADKAISIAEVGPDVGIINALPDGRLVTGDRLTPVLMVVIEIAQRAVGFGGRLPGGQVRLRQVRSRVAGDGGGGTGRGRLSESGQRRRFYSSP